MAAERDPQGVGRHDQEKLRRFLAARRAGDEAGARRHWEDLLTDNYDRVRAMVFLESRGRLSSDEQDEALQRALIKIANNMILTFRGTTIGEWVESTRRLVKFACIDTQRRAAAISKHERPLESRGRDDEDGRDWDPEVYAAIEARRGEEESRQQDEQAISDGRDFLDWAVPQLSQRRREVIELDRADIPVEQIEDRLGVSRDVVYASRSRALKDLDRLRQEQRP